MSLTTHITLLNRLATSDDQQAWALFESKYGGLIRSVARLKGLQGADIDDLVQDVLISLTKALPQFRYDPAKGTFRGYLKTIVLRAIAAKAQKSRQNGPILPLEAYDAPADPESESQWELQWREHHTKRAMMVIESEFNATDLEAFRRYAVLQHEASIVASELSISVDSVYQCKTRILRRLTSLIAQYVAEEG
jgi:RNA polymerase sigma-70 factor (ECF subfamily)